MQYEQHEGGRREDLPSPSIDTGMGLERIAAVLQGQQDNYETDTFRALISASENLTGVSAQGPHRASHRVIADHLRSTSFLLADGVLPASEGRGYVLRRIMRRAMRHAHLLGAEEPVMHKLVPSLIDEMGHAYPELVRAQPLIEEVLEREGTVFRRTLDKGLKLLDGAVAELNENGDLPGDVAFKLYDTYGFPYDLTEDALRERGIGVERAGFDAAMQEQKAAARAAWKGSGEASDSEVWFDISEREGATEFTGYAVTSGDGHVVSLVRGGHEVDAANAGDDVVVLTNQTPFYGESGGQIGDTGTITSADGMELVVRDTAKPLGRLHAHSGKLKAGTIRVGDTVRLSVDAVRRDAIRANHSATHLLHAALRNRLGDHVTQKGSLVAEDRLRFDFSHPKALDAEDVTAIEAEVNRQIRGNDAVSTRLMTPDDAIAAGAMALFGEKYGDEVRVLSMGGGDTDGREQSYSVELCGGTHVRATGDIGVFRIISESAVSSGVRRIEALSGENARNWLVEREDALKRAAAILRVSPDDVASRLDSLMDERKKLEKELAEARKALALAGGAGGAGGPDGDAGSGHEEIGGLRFSGQIIDGLDPKELRGLLDQAKQQLATGVAAICAVNDGKAAFAVGVTDDLTSRINAVDLVRAGVSALGGKGGGGRPDMAQGGGPDGAKAKEAIAAVKALLSS